MSFRESFLDEVCSEGDLDPFVYVKMSNESMPEEFYRYRAFSDNNKDALRNGYEWMSYPNEYNDPFDARLFYDADDVINYVLNSLPVSRLDKDELKVSRKIIGVKEIDLNAGRFDNQLLQGARKKGGKLTSKVKGLVSKVDEIIKVLPKDLDSELEKHVRERSMICSFTTTCDNELMWAHYTYSHQGYCLEYGQPDIHPQKGGLLLPVVYREKPLFVTGFMKDSFPDGKNASKAVIGSAIVKSKRWEYEDEWRYCLLCNEESRHLKAFKPKRLLLGCNANESTKKELIEICQQIGLPMYQMERSPSSFAIVIGKQLV